MIDDRIILVVVRRLIVGYTYVFIITNMDFRIIMDAQLTNINHR